LVLLKVTAIVAPLASPVTSTWYSDSWLLPLMTDPTSVTPVLLPRR
jgi:hypothetical protein